MQRTKNSCRPMFLCTLMMQYHYGRCSTGLVVTHGDGYKPEKSSKTH